MVGVQSTQRCGYCKRRKIKCDENWPTCTPCARSGRQCSGSSRSITFVNASGFVRCDGRSSLSSRSSSPNPVPKSRQFAMVNIKSQDMAGGATYGLYRFSTSPRPALTTLAGRLSTRLVGHIERDSTTQDVTLNMKYLELLPSRLDDSAALRDCVAVFCSGWSNFRRKIPAEEWVTPSVYGKALRSLQQALAGPHQLDCETLAAISVLERFDVLFDRNRMSCRTLHARGIRSLMIRRGPPKLNDDLDIQLTLENQATLLSHCTVEGGDNFFLQSPWKEVMEQVRVRATSLYPQFETSYKLEPLFSYWPILARQILALNNNSDRGAARPKALSLSQQISQYLIEAEAVGDPLLDTAQELCVFSVTLDQQSPAGVKYDAKNLQYATLVIGYLTLKVIFNHMLYDLAIVQGLPGYLYYVNYRTHCQQIWGFIPFTLRQGPIAAMSLITPFYLSFEAAEGEAERQYLFNFVREVDKYKERLPKDDDEATTYLVNVGRIMTGRPSTMPVPTLSNYQDPIEIIAQGTQFEVEA